jgi:hypothetical protein
MSLSPLNRVSTTLHHFVRLFPISPVSLQSKHNKTPIKIALLKFQTHHITSFSFLQAAYGRCNTQIDYRRWVVYMIYGKCRDVTSANMFWTLYGSTDDDAKDPMSSTPLIRHN